MKINTKQLILVGLFAALTAAGAFISIPIGSVPITLQFLFTTLAGIILGSRLGALSQLIFVLIGLLGLPVFAGGKGGFNMVISPTFGYLIGFILSAYIIGKITEGTNKAGVLRLFTAALIGMIVIYAVGVPYLYFIIKNIIGKNISFTAAFKSGCLLFIPGDLIKCVLAALLGVRIIPSLKQIMH